VAPPCRAAGRTIETTSLVTKPSVLMVGLDGAGWRLLEPWARAKRLPHLASLMERGAWGALRSTIPALTLPAWSSFMTGRNPGGHGVYAFRRLAPDRYDGRGLASAADLHGPTLWDVIGAAGRRVGVVNVPPSYPLRPVNGFMVGCMLTPPGVAFTHPPELTGELGDYVIDTKTPRDLRPENPVFRTRALEYAAALRRQTERRTAACVHLMRAHPVDAFCVVFYAPDRLQHYFWNRLQPEEGVRPEPDQEIDAALAATYAAVDDAIGALVAEAGPQANVVLLSDHGFTHSPRRSVRINRWLADAGLLAQRPLWTLRRKVIRKALPKTWRARYDTLDHILVNRARTQAWSDTIFTNTAAIWVHAAGRYPLGCVAPGAPYEAVRDRIKTGLEALRDEGGARVFRGVFRREEIYSGPYVDAAPDLVAECEPDFGIVYESLRRDLRERTLFGPFREEGYTGTHDPEGLYLFAGPAIDAHGRDREYPIESIAPTVLHLLGLAVPRSMEGPVCASVLRADHRAAHPIEYTDVETAGVEATGEWGSAEAEAQIAEHLKGLGYME